MFADDYGMFRKVIPSYRIKVMARGQSSISKCQMSKITCFGKITV